MIGRVNDTFGLTPGTALIADTAYGTGAMLDWLDQAAAGHDGPHIHGGRQDTGRKDGTFERADFTYEAKADVYTCPGEQGAEAKPPGLHEAPREETRRGRHAPLRSRQPDKSRL